MTMEERKCDVCLTGQAIGVAATIMPYSCAYCKECCQRFAQPLVVFECFWEDVGTDFSRLADGMDQLETYDCGRYQTYREWAARRTGAGQVYNGHSGNQRPDADPVRGGHGGGVRSDHGDDPV